MNLHKEIEKLESEIKKNENPIQANPDNPRAGIMRPGFKDVPKDGKAKADELNKEIEKMDAKLAQLGPGGHKPDRTGPHGRGLGPGKRKGDGSGLKQDEEEKKESIRHYLGQKKEFVQMAGKVFAEGKVYIKSPAEAPPGANVQQGPKGGYYYDDGGVKKKPKGEPIDGEPKGKKSKSEFNKWFDTFLDEKELSEQSWEITGSDGGTNIIGSDVVIEAIKNANPEEQKEIKNMIVKIDYANENVNDYLKHLAKGLIETRIGEPKGEPAGGEGKTPSKESEYKDFTPS